MVDGAPQTERLNFVQGLRVFLIAMVVAHHAAEPYNAAGGEWRELLDDPARSDLLLYFFLLNRTYFMGFFFLIAGYFVEASYDRRGAWGFAAAKLVRLGIPLLVIVTFGFGTIGYALYGAGAEYWSWLWRSYLLGGNAEYGPLWFAAHLLVYTLIYAGLRGLGLPGAPRLAPPGHRAILAFAIALGAATALLRPVFPMDDWVRLAGNVPAEPGRVPQYLGLFVVGLLAGRGRWFAGIGARIGAVWFGIGAGVFLSAAALGLPRQALGGDVSTNMVWGMLEGFVGVGMILGLLVLFRAACQTGGGWLAGLAGQVYGVYLIHIFIVIGVQFALVSHDWPALAKFVVVTAVTLAASFALVALLRLIPGMRRVI